jgi:hypothetical protein
MRHLQPGAKTHQRERESSEKSRAVISKLTAVQTPAAERFEKSECGGHEFIHTRVFFFACVHNIDPKAAAPLLCKTRRKNNSRESGEGLLLL